MSSTETPAPRLPPPWFKHAFWRAHRAVYLLSGGRFLWTPASKRGWGALHLTTIGRKSGRARSVLLGYLEDGSDLVTLAMNGWDEGDPAWWLNLQVSPIPSSGSPGSSHARCEPTPRRARIVLGCGSSGSRSILSWTRTPPSARPRPPWSCSSRAHSRKRRPGRRPASPVGEPTTAT